MVDDHQVDKDLGPHTEIYQEIILKSFFFLKRRYSSIKKNTFVQIL